MRHLLLPLAASLLLSAPGLSQTLGLGSGPISTVCDHRGGVATVGLATYGAEGLPDLVMRGAPLIGFPFQLEVRGLAGAPAALLTSPEETAVFLPPFGATLYPGSPLSVRPFLLDADGASPPLLHQDPVSAALCGRTFVAQAIVLDPGALGGVAFTHALRVRYGLRGSEPVFEGSATLALGHRPFDLAIGDLDGDQLADVVTSNADGTVTLLFNLGGGTFAAPQSLTANNQPVEGIAIGDMNGDRIADLVCASPFGGNGGDLSILLGLGGGAFGPPRFFRGGQGPASVAIDDLDGDGILDLAVADIFNAGGAFAFGAVSVLLGVGDGTFGSPQTYEAGVSVQSVAIGDLNGDRIPDLAVANMDSVKFAGESSPTVSVLLGIGDGTFQRRRNFPVSPEKQADSLNVVIADLDRDGASDLVFATIIGFSGGHASVLMGAGDGTFEAPTSYPAAGGPSSVAVGDFDGDQIDDLAVANFDSDDVSLLRGLGDGTFAAPWNRPAGNGPRAIAAGDLDGDHVPDMVLVNVWADDATVFLNELLGESP